MKNRTFSAALFRENIKRFWPISAVGLFIYFISGPLVLFTSKDLGLYESRYFGNYSSYLVSQMRNNINFGFEFMHLVLPLVAAVCVFSYLNKVNSVGAVHSMPFSRRSLFVTNYLSGLSLCVIPLLVTFLLLIPGMQQLGGTAADAALWLLGSFTIVIFVFSLAVLACIVSGNSIIAILTGGAFNIVMIAIVYCLYGYAAKFLYGFTNSLDILETGTFFSPLIKTLSAGLKVKECIIYIVVAVVIAVAADILYHVRKLERCGDSYVFGWMRNLVSFIFVFVITTITGLLLFEGIGITAYIIGFVIGFVLGQMITMKTFHIFNKTSLRNLVIFALIMAVIIGCFALDVFGFEKRVPDAKNVESVSVRNFLIRDASYNPVEFKYAPSIETAIALHRELIDWHEKFYDSGEHVTLGNVEISYKLKNGRVMERNLLIPDSIMKGEYFTRLLQSEENRLSIVSLPDMTGKEAYISLSDPNNYEAWNTHQLDRAEMRSFLLALSKDLENIITDTEAYVAANSEDILRSITLDVVANSNNMAAEEDYYRKFYGFGYTSMSMIGSDDGKERLSAEFSYHITASYSNTVKWLEANGLMK